MKNSKLSIFCIAIASLVYANKSASAANNGLHEYDRRAIIANSIQCNEATQWRIQRFLDWMQVGQLDPRTINLKIEWYQVDEDPSPRGHGADYQYATYQKWTYRVVTTSGIACKVIYLKNGAHLDKQDSNCIGTDNRYIQPPRSDRKSRRG